MHSNTSSASSNLNPSVPYSSTSDRGEVRHQHPAHVKRHHHADALQPGLFFLISRDVTLSYGPYVVLGVMDYRTDQLQGLTKALQNGGGEVKLVPSYHVNEVRIWHLERLIFSCKITDLYHGGDGALDPICKAAEKALEQSSRRAYFNLKYRYQIDPCLLNVCPCHSGLHGNDSLARVPCRKVKVKRDIEDPDPTLANTTAKAGPPNVEHQVEPSARSGHGPQDVGKLPPEPLSPGQGHMIPMEVSIQEVSAHVPKSPEDEAYEAQDHDHEEEFLHSGQTEINVDLQISGEDFQLNVEVKEE